jgi:hypothetical protein
VVRLLPCVLLIAACDPGFESKSIVIDLRMLAIAGDPPEVVEDFDVENPVLPSVPPVTVTGLVADPEGLGPLAWRLSACPPEQSRRCEKNIQPMGQGVGLPMQASLQAGADLLLASFEGGEQDFSLGGLRVMVALEVWPEGRRPEDGIVGAKMLIYAPRIPPERVANRNPTMTAILVDDAEEWIDDGVCRPVTAGVEVRLEPVESEGARETYLLPTLDGGARAITENLRYAWFATGGSFSAESTGGPVDFFGNRPPLHTRWKAPEDQSGTFQLWLVQRDERGGTSWTERCFDVALP